MDIRTVLLFIEQPSLALFIVFILFLIAPWSVGVSAWTTTTIGVTSPSAPIIYYRTLVSTAGGPRRYAAVTVAATAAEAVIEGEEVAFDSTKQSRTAPLVVRQGRRNSLSYSEDVAKVQILLERDVGMSKHQFFDLCLEQGPFSSMKRHAGYGGYGRLVQFRDVGDILRTLPGLLDYLFNDVGMSRDDVLRAFTRIGGGQMLMQEASAVRERVTWLQETLELTSSELSKIIASMPSIVAMRLGGLSLKLAWLQDELHLTKEQQTKLIVSYPAVLGLSIEDNLRPKVLWLENALCVKRTLVCKLITQLPTLLSVSIDDILAPKILWLETELGLTKRQVVKVITSSPSILGLSMENNLKLKIQWLRDEMGLSAAKVSTLVVRFPSIFALRIEDNLAAKVRWLETELNLSRKQVARILVAYPSIFALSWEENLPRKLEWLEENLDTSKAKISKLLVSYPSLLCLSVEENMAPKLEWLRQELGLCPAEVSRVILSYPPILGLSIENALIPKIDYLKTAMGLETRQETAYYTVLKLPSVFGLSLGNIKAKLDFYRDELGATSEDLQSVGGFLSCSLSRRLQPRTRMLREAGVTPNYKSHRSLVAVYPDDKFRVRLAKLSNWRLRPTSMVMGVGGEEWKTSDREEESDDAAGTVAATSDSGATHR